MFVNGFSIEELGGRYCGGTCTYRVRGRGGGGGGADKGEGHTRGGRDGLMMEGAVLGGLERGMGGRLLLLVTGVCRHTY